MKPPVVYLLKKPMKINTDFTSPTSNRMPFISSTMNPHDFVEFSDRLKPRKYHIKGCDSNSKILFRNVNIIDSTGRDPFQGDVYIEGKPLQLKQI